MEIQFSLYFPWRWFLLAFFNVFEKLNKKSQQSPQITKSKNLANRSKDKNNPMEDTGFYIENQ
jgi:hypothetical protein